MSEDEKLLTAYHEGGHALVSLHVKGADPVHKVTIMPRGRALGVTWQLPTRERFSTNMHELTARLAVLMGGKAAEEVVYGSDKVTTGCSSDLKAASALARAMVMKYGMGGRHVALDPEDYGKMSEETKKQVDDGVNVLLNDAYQKAKAVVVKHSLSLHRIASALVKFETLNYEQVRLAATGGDMAVEGLGGKCVPTKANQVDTTKM